MNEEPLKAIFLEEFFNSNYKFFSNLENKEEENNRNNKYAEKIITNNCLVLKNILIPCIVSDLQSTTEAFNFQSALVDKTNETLWFEINQLGIKQSFFTTSKKVSGGTMNIGEYVLISLYPSYSHTDFPFLISYVQKITKKEYISELNSMYTELKQRRIYLENFDSGQILEEKIPETVLQKIKECSIRFELPSISLLKEQEDNINLKIQNEL